MRYTQPLLVMLLALCALPAIPQTGGGTVYAVEVIVFRTARELAGGGDIAAPGSGSNAARFVSALPASSFRMDEIANRLSASGAYRPVAHVAWSQTAGPWGSRSGIDLGRVGLAAEGVAGTVYLERGDYLHLGFSMSYGGSAIDEIRRVRLNEKNYYDNPNFGVIAVVTAVR